MGNLYDPFDDTLQRMRELNAKAAEQISQEDQLRSQNMEMMHETGGSLPPNARLGMAAFDGPPHIYDLKAAPPSQEPTYQGPMDSHYTGVSPREPSTWKTDIVPPWMKANRTPAGM